VAINTLSSPSFFARLIEGSGGPIRSCFTILLFLLSSSKMPLLWMPSEIITVILKQVRYFMGSSFAPLLMALTSKLDRESLLRVIEVSRVLWEFAAPLLYMNMRCLFFDPTLDSSEPGDRKLKNFIKLILIRLARLRLYYYYLLRP